MTQQTTDITQTLTDATSHISSSISSDISQNTALNCIQQEMQLNSMFINGEWQKIIEKSTEESTDEQTQNIQTLINPATTEILATCRLATEADVDAAVQAAHTAWQSWKTTTGVERATYLEAIANAMQAKFNQLVSLSVINNGKPIAEASIDIQDAIACYRYYATLAKQLPTKQMIDANQVTINAEAANDWQLYRVDEPIGVCALITPWNFPLVTTAWKLAPALAAGCTVVLKPSELTLLPELMMGNLIAEAGLPAGVVNILPGNAQVGSAMTSHPLVDKVSFTGSNAVGEKVMMQAAKTVKNISLELGGKSAIVVRQDADIEQACDIIIGGIFYNAGQVCSATSRLLVHSDIADSLYNALKQKIDSINIGSGFDNNTQMGPLISEQQYQQVQRYFKLAEAEGLSCLTGGTVIFSTNTHLPKNAELKDTQLKNNQLQAGYFVAPTVYINTPTTSQLWQQEIFGPVLVSCTFNTDAEAIELANDSDYALAATVVSADVQQAWSLAQQIRAGHIWINEQQIVLAESGWGGFKHSGIGRELGREGLAAYLGSKHILLPKAGND